MFAGMQHVVLFPVPAAMSVAMPAAMPDAIPDEEMTGAAGTASVAGSNLLR